MKDFLDVFRWMFIKIFRIRTTILIKISDITAENITRDMNEMINRTYDKRVINIVCRSKTGGVDLTMFNDLLKSKELIYNNLHNNLLNIIIDRSIRHSPVSNEMVKSIKEIFKDAIFIE